MDTTIELAKALVNFQKDAPTIAKRKSANIQMKGGGSFAYNYADLTDIWEAIRKPLADNGLAVTQQIGVKEGFEGNGIYTKIWHNSGESDEKWLHIEMSGKTPQESGSIITYYKRYALGAALGISTEEDDDGAAGSNRQQNKQNGNSKGHPKASPKRRPTDSQLDLIKKLGVKLGKDEQWLGEVYHKIHSSADASAVIQKLKSQVDSK